MNSVTYQITKQEYSCNGERRIAYGIAAYATTSQQPLTCIRDLSADRAAVEALVERCNRAGLSIEHLQDIAEDFLVAL